MKQSTKDRAQGRAKETKGKTKKTAAKATGDKKLRARGTAEEMSGKGRRKIGEAEKFIED